MDRRTFLLGGIATAIRPAPDTPQLETFSDWTRASRAARQRALQPCLDRIRSLDPSIEAWVVVKPQQATGSGRLDGIPFAAKDIMETAGLTTEYGSPVYKGHVSTKDAAIVRDLRRRGAVLVGKTHTAAFAYRTPPPTHNPRNLAHTPGGSSSGSAAAVAAGMVPLALGTQTGGSVLRPASFCGVAGFKTTYGLLPMEGVLQFAKSLDTLGFFAHTAADMLAFWEAFGQPAGTDEDFPLAAPDPLPPVDAAMATAFSSARAKLRRAGLTVKAIDITDVLAKLSEAQRIVMFYEGAHVHEQRYKEHGAKLGDLAELIREGLAMAAAKYDEAVRYIAECKSRVAELYKAAPIILVPAAVGAAPRGLTSTGDSRMNAPWTALGTPAISIPLPVGNALPLGLQLTGAHGQDARVIRTAVKLEKLLGATT
jgi:Asp-tRNA(Asn)/Glu-tRNA(Gln) amidotransferase A subunit family amidase